MSIYFEQQKAITEKWIVRCNLKFNNKFDYSKVEITNAATKVTIICPIHNEIQMTKNQHEISVYAF